MRSTPLQQSPKKSQQQTFDYCLKTIIIGDSGVGKSSLLLRYQSNIFQESYITTIGMNYSYKIEPIDNLHIKLQIWDTAGQQKYRNITQNYYRNSDGAIVAFSIDSSKSFQAVVGNWIGELGLHLDMGDPNDHKGKVQVILVGTKCDLDSERQVSRQEALELANKYGIQYKQCSAKSGESVNEVFRNLTLLMKKNIIEKRIQQSQKQEQQEQKGRKSKILHLVRGQSRTNNSESGVCCK